MYYKELAKKIIEVASQELDSIAEDLFAFRQNLYESDYYDHDLSVKEKALEQRIAMLQLRIDAYSNLYKDLNKLDKKARNSNNSFYDAGLNVTTMLLSNKEAE